MITEPIKSQSTKEEFKRVFFCVIGYWLIRRNLPKRNLNRLSKLLSADTALSRNLPKRNLNIAKKKYKNFLIFSRNLPKRNLNVRTIERLEKTWERRNLPKRNLNLLLLFLIALLKKVAIYQRGI